jgi:hypothetical protein
MSGSLERQLACDGITPHAPCMIGHASFTSPVKLRSLLRVLRYALAHFVHVGQVHLRGKEETTV